MITELGRFAQIPYEILFNQDLNGTDVKIWAIIDSFVSHGKSFIGSNKYLSDVAGISEHQVTASLSKLKTLDYIEVVGFNGRVRELTTRVKVDIKSKEKDKFVRIKRFEED